MNLETQENYLKIIELEFKILKEMLDGIHDKITQYPVYTQLAFMTPLKRCIILAYEDAMDDNNEFLNNFKGGDDSIEINLNQIFE